MDKEEPRAQTLTDADAIPSMGDTTVHNGGVRPSGGAANGSTAAGSTGARGRARPREAKDPGIWPHTTRVLPWLAAAFLFMLWLVPFDSITAPFSLGVDSKLDRLALIVMFGAWLLLSAAGGRHGPRFRSSPLNVAILLFLVVVFAGLFARLPILSNLDELVPSVKQLALLLSYFALFYFVATVLRAKEVPNFLNFLMVLACLTAIGTILEYRGHGNYFYNWSATILKGFHITRAALGNRFGRVSVVGPTEAPLADAAILSIALSFALVYLIHARNRWGKVMWFLACALLLAGTFATQRKSAAIIPLGAIVALIIYKPRQMFRALPLFILLIAAVYVIAPHAISGLRYQFFDIGTSTSTTARTNDYTAITPDILAHPILGRGYGEYAPHVYRILDNQYLGLLVETGFVGLASYLLIMITGGVLAHRASRSLDPRRAMAGVALMGAIGGFIIANGTFDVLAFAQVPYMLMYVLALTVVAADRSEAEEEEAVAVALAQESPHATPHRRARVERPPRRPVDAPRRPSTPRVPVSQPRGERRSLGIGSRWSRRLRGPHAEMPARTRWTAMTMSATAMAVVLGLVMARAPSAHLGPSQPAKRPAAPATGPSSSYANGLNQVMSQLNTARASDGARLTAAHAPQAQAAAARQLSAAHRQAASAVLALHPASAASANASLAGSLQRAGDAYAALATAAAHRDTRAYNRARASITQANRALDSAYAQLAKLGYRVA